MRFRLILLPLGALALAGCQTMGIHHPTTPSAAQAPSSTAASAPNSPWAAARARGMAFRAAGSQPTWSVEVQKNHSPTLFVVLQDSGRHLQVPDATVSSNEKTGTIKFQGMAGDGTPVELTIRRGQCKDDMSGQKLADSAKLDVGANQYKGCGKFLIQ